MLLISVDYDETPASFDERDVDFEVASYKGIVVSMAIYARNDELRRSTEVIRFCSAETTRDPVDCFIRDYERLVRFANNKFGGFGGFVASSSLNDYMAVLGVEYDD